MTQPPDDAALVATQTWAGIRMTPGAATPELRDAARKTDLFRHGDMLLMWVNEGDLMVADMAARRAATALEAKDRRIAELEAALTKAADEFDLILMRLKDGQDERAAGAAICGARDARAALEPSDKGVGR